MHNNLTQVETLRFNLQGQIQSAKGPITIHWKAQLNPGKTVVLSGESGCGKTVCYVL